MLERCWRAIRRAVRRLIRPRSALGGRWSETQLGRRWQLSRLRRSLDGVTASERLEPACPPIEQVAGDLRRLNRLRGGGAVRAAGWVHAVLRAYYRRAPV